MTSMTGTDALKQAISLFPLDLVARIAYIEMKRDTCDVGDLAAWNEAARLTRHGLGEPDREPDTDAEPDYDLARDMERGK